MTRYLWRALCVGLCVVLAGCGGDAPPEEPTTLPPISTPAGDPTPSGTPAPSGSATPRPGQFDEATQAEAEAFVEEWWANLNSVLAGGSADALEDMYLPTCDYCGQLYAEAAGYEAARTRAEGGEQLVLRTDFVKSQPGSAIVQSVVEPQPGELLDDEGNVLRELNGGVPVQFIFNLIETDAGLAIQDLLNLGESPETMGNEP